LCFSYFVNRVLYLCPGLVPQSSYLLYPCSCYDRCMPPCLDFINWDRVWIPSSVQQQSSGLPTAVLSASWVARITDVYFHTWKMQCHSLVFVPIFFNWTLYHLRQSTSPFLWWVFSR
jgi:hypothetical protein